MKKGLVGLMVVVFTMVFATSAMAVAVWEEPKLEYPSVRAASVGIRESIRHNPVSVANYIDTGIDLVTEAGVRILKTGKPVWVFVGEGKSAVEVSIFEQPSFDVVIGILTEDTSEWMGGIEVKGIPFAGGISEILDKISLGAVYCKGQLCFSIAYVIRE